jgi:hypothetical protein
MKAFCSFILLLAFSSLSFAQVKFLEAGQSPGNGKVEELNWLVGYWTGPGLGGECEEVWMPAVDGHMVGTFRLWKDGQLVFSEFLNLVQDGESISLKLKHFNPDLSGWEDKEKWTTFRLVELGESAIYFHGLTLKREGEQMMIYLVLNQNGERRTEEFRYTRKAL